MNKKKTPPPLPPLEEWFDEIWNDYPEQKGKKEALRQFKATVKTDTDLERIRTALKNYKDQVEHDRTRKDGFNRTYQNGGTWFKNWREWVDRSIQIQQNRPVEGIYPEPNRRPEEEQLKEEFLAIRNAFVNESESAETIKIRVNKLLNRDDIFLDKYHIDSLNYILEKIDEVVVT